MTGATRYPQVEHRGRGPQVHPRESALVTAPDLERLAGAMPGLEAMPYLGAVLGMRWAEVAGLRVGSLDFLRFTIAIVRQWTRGRDGEMVSQDPKSRAGRRVLTVPDWLMAMLAAHLAARGLTAPDLDAFVFVGPGDKPLHYSNWRQRVWLPATKAAQLDGLRFHDLRHTAGTALVAGGVDIKTAQVRLGHASPVTTLRVYAQATQDADRAAARSLGDLFRPSTHGDGLSVDATGSDDVKPGKMCDGWNIVALATTCEEPRNPADQDFPGGARWNRTTDLSIISAAL
jgi:integrase